jgi:hypothetical protein
MDIVSQISMDTTCLPENLVCVTNRIKTYPVHRLHGYLKILLQHQHECLKNYFLLSYSSNTVKIKTSRNKHSSNMF